MKHFLIALSFVFTGTMFAQNNHVISGALFDGEIENSPLAFAEVLIKETGEKMLTNTQGTFKFEALENKTYTLVFSFAGYDNKEVAVANNSTNKQALKIALQAKTISFDDLASVLEKADNKATSN
ncbi:carboxypeptidase-like regulatory domain-containing protein [Tamlana sp. 62-3]|uniref:Carboxypeptidase-like regulatory domain-containing protein n=1 Tax=Neotamlana sargassicola TaxID=2883125 RepID=A0A9X1I638_9FLAO|nr:carboxypeptidase-like regulatory domain-containing protein [Tamlana sargassicola]MCB4806881.1 carboxypeptidase-like regulatory domain-containing protein [Tamlana sargassicola]